MRDMKTKNAGSRLVDFFTKPKAFLTGAVIGLVVATIVVTRFFSPTKEVVHEVETLSPLGCVRARDSAKRAGLRVAELRHR